MAEQTIRVEIGSAWSAHRQNHNDEAVKAFQAVLNRDPNNIDAFYGKGLAERASGQKAAATNSFEQALTLVTHAADSLANRSKRFGKLKALHDDAVKGFNQAIRAVEQPTAADPVGDFQNRHNDAVKLMDAVMAAMEDIRQHDADQHGHVRELENKYRESLEALRARAAAVVSAAGSAEATTQARTQYRGEIENLYDVFGPLEQSNISERRTRDRLMMMGRMIRQRLEELKA